jgi:hypothetical protein
MVKATAAAAVSKVRKALKQSPPCASAYGALAVTDDHDCNGRIVESDGVFWAFDINNKLVGAFATLGDAVREIPIRRDEHADH